MTRLALRSLRSWRQVLAWPARRYVVAVIAAVGAAVLIGVPTRLIHTSLFARMTPVRSWNVPVWIISSVLMGLLVATFARVRTIAGPVGTSRLAAGGSGGVLSAFAVGCPVCNKLVVAAIGTSGALNVWAPLQPGVAMLSIALLIYAVTKRLDGEVTCGVSPPVLS